MRSARSSFDSASSARRSSRGSSPARRPSVDSRGGGRSNAPSYPLRAYLNFVPGGIAYPRPTSSSDQTGSADVNIARSSSNVSDTNTGVDSHYVMLKGTDPVRLISKAMECDVQLQTHRNDKAAAPPSSPSSSSLNPAVHYVPSLSFLTEAIFHPLTGVPAAHVRHWLDSILLMYFSLDTANMMDPKNGSAGGACSNCTLAAAALGSTLDITTAMRDRAGSASVVASDGKNMKQPPSLHSRSYSGESVSTGSVSSTGGAGGIAFSGLGSLSSSHPTSIPGGGTSTSVQFQSLLKHLASHHSSSSSTNGMPQHRPCGYVFKRGDIAWNCRTCQTDPTCVLCDTCFHDSNHEGHEVFFHRTSPGGCCDCGDLEAWRVDGCCPAHRPSQQQMMLDEDGDGDKEMTDDDVGADLEDEFEAVKSALRGREANASAVQSLPPCLRSALGVVIGAAVQCVVRAVDGAGIGADASQWKMRWAEQVSNITNGCAHEEEYALRDETAEQTARKGQGYLTPPIVLDGSRSAHANTGSSSGTSSIPWSATSPPQSNTQHETANRQSSNRSSSSSDTTMTHHQQQWDGYFPQNFKLQLRLHNDDVHTFDEVIDALYVRPSNSSNNSSDSAGDASSGLVNYREDADTMTHHVDSDGQVTVKSYTSFASALSGFTRLKSKGLLCSVVSSAQVDLEGRARIVLKWLMEMSKLHGGVAALVVHALVDVTGGEDELVDGCGVWPEPRTCVFPWSSSKDVKVRGWMTREDVREYYWTKLQSGVGGIGMQTDDIYRAVAANSYEGGAGLGTVSSVASRDCFDPTFYSSVPFHLPSESLRKSPHALWGTLPTPSLPGFTTEGQASKSLLLKKRRLMIIDTDIRKQQEADTLTTSLQPHRRAGLSIVSGVSLFEDGFVHPTTGTIIDAVTSPYTMLQNLTVSQREIEYLVNRKTSYQAPSSPILLMLLLDPYPTKQFRHTMHNLFLSLLTESRFRTRFAAALGAVSYRPLTTLFCAGVGTENDSPLSFTVQIFTAGSIVTALGNGMATACLLECDAKEEVQRAAGDVDGDELPTRTLPVALTILRAIHTNLLGATKEVQMLLQNTAAAAASASGSSSSGSTTGSAAVAAVASSGSIDSATYRHLHLGRGSTPSYSTATTMDQATFSPAHAGQGYLPALVYQNGEHPQSTLLPAAPDDGFLDSRSTRHKRLPHLLRDLEYIFETPGTALKLLSQFNMNPNERQQRKTDKMLEFPNAFARLLRLAQNMDPQKRKISGGHVEYEQQRWLDAFGLSLNLAGMRDALVESPTLLLSSSNTDTPSLGEIHNNMYYTTREAMGNLFTALLREVKLCLYREGLLENGLLPASYSSAVHSHNTGVGGGLALGGQVTEALQRSTLHVSSPSGAGGVAGSSVGIGGVALACATGVKMTEAQLNIIENALRNEYGYSTAASASSFSSAMDLAVSGGVGSVSSASKSTESASDSGGGVIMGDWLKVPHAPLSGDWLSFHLPLHRALARSIKSLCSIPVPACERDAYPASWWKLPILDGADYYQSTDGSDNSPQHGQSSRSPSSLFQQHNYLSQLLLPTLRSSNCRVVWSNPDASPEQNSIRRIRSYTVSSTIASAKVVHSLADHPLRCLAASTQIEKHLWARNGSAAAGMAHNYASAPLCKSFRDLDLCLLQFSAAGFDVGLGARRTLALMLSRFSMDGYLVDPALRRSTSSKTAVGAVGHGKKQWVHPPRLQDPDHAPALAESFFATLCLLVTELPPPPPMSDTDDTAVRGSMRRELLHALAAEPRSYSEALAAAVSGATRRDHQLHSQSTSGSDASAKSSSSSLRSIFSDLLREVARERQSYRAVSGSTVTRRGSAGAPTFELTADCADEYDPTFYHLRRNEHQHAMDTVARLRKVKCASGTNSGTAVGGSGDPWASPSRRRTRSMNSHPAAAALIMKGEKCLPLVCPPPEAHPRFLPARLILHLPTMDAAVRRKLLYALTGGQWLPPPEPPKQQEGVVQASFSGDGTASVESASSGDQQPVLLSASSSGSFGSLRSRRSTASSTEQHSSSAVPFSPAVVASSAVSSLEVLQILTLQVHTLEYCAALHRMQKLDKESAQLSSTISVNSYLARLCHVPSSLENCWALGCPHPLPSAGSGESRGSILGLLIVLYEHSYYVNRGDENSSSSGSDMDKSSAGTGSDSHSGGARALAADGIKWLLRFVHALVHGAPSVSAAVQSATDGVPIQHLRKYALQGASRSPTRRLSDSAAVEPAWTISVDIQSKINGMLSHLPKLWPVDESTDAPGSVQGKKAAAAKVANPDDEASSSDFDPLSASTTAVSSSSPNAPSPSGGSVSSPDAKKDMTKAKMDLRKAAQARAMKLMMMQRSKFLDSIGGSGGDDTTDDMDVDSEFGDRTVKKDDDEDDDECIICHCAEDDSDSPLGFLGHVQRSRTLQLRSLAECCGDGGGGDDDMGTRDNLGLTARVVGDRGCQLRATASLDSAPVACLPLGSIVTILQSKVSPKCGLLSRRVLVRHVTPSGDTADEMPRIVEGWASVQSSHGYVILSPLSHLCFSRWGLTRPILRLCGHAAHLGCVEAHCLSLHQRAAGEHPYDGRFAANIEEGEFLCPLCKQISNVLVPKQPSPTRDAKEKPAERKDEKLRSAAEQETPRVITDQFEALSDVLVKRHREFAVSLPRNEEGKTDKKSKAEKAKDATSRYRSQLFQAMQIAWEPSSSTKRNKLWHPAITKWDYEEDESSEGSNSRCGAGKVLRLFREQHIAWSAVGYGAAAAEASTRISHCRGTEDDRSAATAPSYASSASDPWTGYDHQTRDTHASLLELRRIMGATTGLLDILGEEIGRISTAEAGRKTGNAFSLEGRGVLGIALVGQLLLDIIDGRSGAVSSLIPSLTEAATGSHANMKEEWRVLSALLASMPCHVARDGMLSPRHEARATSAAMWAVKGCSTAPPSGDSTAMDDSSQASPSSTPPAPLAVRRLCEESCSYLHEGWGSSNVLECFSVSQDQASATLAFRPAVASCFLYLPFLSWDMNTLAGAIFSTLLYDSRHVCGDDLARATRILLAGRLVQALITPNGYVADRKSAKDADTGSPDLPTVAKWTEQELSCQARALGALRARCLRRRGFVAEGSDAKTEMTVDDSALLLAAVGDAILPFARALVLLLRVGFSTLGQAQKKCASRYELSAAEKQISSLVEDPNAMKCLDGFYLMRAMGGPLPIDLLGNDESNSTPPKNSWHSKIDQWLDGVIALESYHGSRGHSARFDTVSKQWVSSYAADPGKSAEQENVDNVSSERDRKPAAAAMFNNGQIEQSELSGGAAGGSLAMEDDDSARRSIDLDGPEAMLDDEDEEADSSFDEDEEDVGDYDDDEEMVDDDEEDDNSMHDAAGFAMANFRINRMVDDDDMDSVDEEMEAAEEDVNFDEAALGGDPSVLLSLSRRRTASSSAEWKDDDEESSECSIISSSNNDDGVSARRSTDREYANVSRAAIIPFQPSLLQKEGVGPGPRGNSLDTAVASRLMYDMSHLGLVHRNGMLGSGLIKLPRSFVELYSLVNKIKGEAMDDQEEGGSSETAICLITGAVMRSGSIRRAFSRQSTRPPGACTIHARKVGSGIGVFFLVQKCTVLLMHNNKSAYSASLYVDENGEEDPGLRRGRPLFLLEERYQALETLWRQHGIPREVAQTRSTSDRVIRDNWY